MKIVFSTGEVFSSDAPLSVFDAAKELGIVTRAHICHLKKITELIRR